MPPAARACFVEAIGHADVELAVVTNSDEGAPEVRFLHTSAGRPGFDVYANATWDDLGARGWYRLRCDGPVAADPLQRTDCDLV